MNHAVSSKLFLNTFPLHTMLRSGDAVDDPECVSTTISAAKAILDLGHKYAELGVLRHCPDVNFLLLLYAAVFLIKVKASNTRFAQLVDSDELQGLMLQSISDCQAATCSSKHAASTCMIMLRALFSSWKAMSAPPLSTSGGGVSFNGTSGQHGGNLSESDISSVGGGTGGGIIPLERISDGRNFGSFRAHECFRPTRNSFWTSYFSHSLHLCRFTFSCFFSSFRSIRSRRSRRRRRREWNSNS